MKKGSNVPGLASGRSPRWAFMERFEVPDYEDPDVLYLTRWRLVQTPWFGIYLHKLGGPDPRATLHDHPWQFFSIVLRGGYDERRQDPMTMKVDECHIVRRFNHMGLQDAHSIRTLHRTPSWTLVFVGKRVRTWGYWERDGEVDSWHFTEFNKHPFNDEFERAMAIRKERAHT